MDWRAAQHALQVLSTKWTLLVLVELGNVARSYNDLARITALDSKTLSRCLASMENAGLVEREALDQPSKKRRCHLTVRGRAVLDIVAGLASLWDETTS